MTAYEADFIVVGGGTAGSVLAARLSEDPATRVVLVEAGRDTPPGAVPHDIQDPFPNSFFNRDYFWPGLEARGLDGDEPRPFLQGRVMGGGSSVMGMWALRGLPADYDAWAAAGARGWGWADVLPYFRRLTRDVDQGAADAPRGPTPVRRWPRDEWPGFVRGLADAAARRGLPLHGDINEASGDGVFAMPLSQDQAGRATSARAYLTDEVRRRRNLTILADARVTALTFDGGRVSGVRVSCAGQTRSITAREVILSAGAIHSPALLLRAGIGPADDLKRAGIPPRVDRPGVGRNLQNHAFVHLAATPAAAFRPAPDMRGYAVAGARLSSGLEGCPAGDLLLSFIARVSTRPFGTRFGMIAAALYAPFSRGTVTIASPDPAAPPDVAFRLLTDARDARRLALVARYAESLLRDPAVTASYHEAYLLPKSPPLRQWNAAGLRGGFSAMAALAVLASPGPLRRVIIGRAIRPGRMLAAGRRHTPLSDAEILAAAAPMFHPSGTCRIGRPDDRLAVVAPDCRVYGAAGLRVVDASVMPQLPSANTNVPTLMLAERAADLIRGKGPPAV